MVFIDEKVEADLKKRFAEITGIREEQQIETPQPDSAIAGQGKQAIRLKAQVETSNEFRTYDITIIEKEPNKKFAMVGDIEIQSESKPEPQHITVNDPEIVCHSHFLASFMARKLNQYKIKKGWKEKLGY